MLATIRHSALKFFSHASTVVKLDKVSALGVVCVTLLATSSFAQSYDQRMRQMARDLGKTATDITSGPGETHMSVIVMDDRGGQWGGDTPNVHGLANQFGECFTPSAHQVFTSYSDVYRSFIGKTMSRKYKALQPRNHWVKQNGAPFSESDFLAVDAMARTLMGEFGNERQCRSEYKSVAARVVLNRAEVTFARPGYGARFIGGDQRETISQAIIQSMLFNKQFSTWNKIAYDPLHATPSQQAQNNIQMQVLGHSLCPVPPNAPPDTVRSWRNAVRIAIETVAFPKLLKAQTPNVRAQYYTSKVPMRGGIEMGAASFVPDIRMPTRAMTLNDTDCVRLWRAAK